MKNFLVVHKVMCGSTETERKKFMRPEIEILHSSPLQVGSTYMYVYTNLASSKPILGPKLKELIGVTLLVIAKSSQITMVHHLLS